MKFYYDSNGIPFILEYNGTTYFYVTNLQGDVIGLATSEGVVAYYKYDAWGNIIAMDSAGSVVQNVLNANPLRYRGYIYDNETGFYYLQSRYYDPVVRRFINADDIQYLGASRDLNSYNLYAYCSNNPVNMTDDSGCLPWFVAAAITGAVTDIVTYLLASAVSGEEITWDGIGKAALEGAISGVVFGAIGKGIKAVNNTIKASKAIKYTTGTANQVGKIGEKLSGIVKNTKSYIVNGRSRIPDGISKRFVQEVKNVKKLSLTSQIKDSIQLADELGKRLQLFIRPDTYLSNPLKQAIKKHKIKISYLW